MRWTLTAGRGVCSPEGTLVSGIAQRSSLTGRGCASSLTGRQLVDTPPKHRRRVTIDTPPKQRRRVTIDTPPKQRRRVTIDTPPKQRRRVTVDTPPKHADVVADVVDALLPAPPSSVAFDVAARVATVDVVGTTVSVDTVGASFVCVDIVDVDGVCQTSLLRKETFE